MHNTMSTLNMHLTDKYIAYFRDILFASKHI